MPATTAGKTGAEGLRAECAKANEDDWKWLNDWLLSMQQKSITVRLGPRGGLDVDEGRLDALMLTQYMEKKRLIASWLSFPAPHHLAAAYRMAHRLMVLAHSRWTGMDVAGHAAADAAEREWLEWSKSAMRLARRTRVYKGLMERVCVMAWDRVPVCLSCGLEGAAAPGDGPVPRCGSCGAECREERAQRLACEPEGPQAMAVEREFRRAPPEIAALARSGLERWSPELWTRSHPLLDELIRWYQGGHPMPPAPPGDPSDPFDW